jgi:hypothetical protein
MMMVAKAIAPKSFNRVLRDMSFMSRGHSIEWAARA